MTSLHHSKVIAVIAGDEICWACDEVKLPNLTYKLETVSAGKTKGAALVTIVRASREDFAELSIPIESDLGDTDWECVFLAQVMSGTPTTQPILAFVTPMFIHKCVDLRSKYLAAALWNAMDDGYGLKGLITIGDLDAAAVEVAAGATENNNRSDRVIEGLQCKTGIGTHQHK